MLFVEASMRRTVVIVLVLLLATTAFGVSGSEVMYVGGSVSAFTPGDIGTFEISSAKELEFVSNGKRLSVAYDKIKQIEYRQEVAVHLGVAPAIVVGLIKRRERKHLITLTYADEAGERQAAVFEVSKSAPSSFLPILAARAPQACVISEKYKPCAAAARRTFTSGAKP
jgi:hypothetical protein